MAQLGMQAAARATGRCVFTTLTIFLALGAVRLCGEPAATSEVTLAWGPSSAPDILGYRIYYGAESLTYTNVVAVGDVSEATVTGLVPGVTYYFAATAVVMDGAESDFSNEISYEVPAGEIDPLQVRIQSLELASVSQTAGSVKVGWTPTTAPNAGYYVYMGRESTAYTDIRWIDVLPNEFQFDGLARGYTYYFAVSALTPDGTEGPLSEPSSVLVPLPELPAIHAEVELMAGGAGAAPTKVLVTWSDVQAPGYVVHYGIASGDYHGSVYPEPGSTEVLIESLVAGRTYYFVVKPVFSGGAEGPGSNELICNVPMVSGPRAALRGNAEGQLVLSAQVSPGATFQVLTSTDLIAWETVGDAVANSAGQIEYSVPVDRGEPQRFYMLRWSPP